MTNPSRNTRTWLRPAVHVAALAAMTAAWPAAAAPGADAGTACRARSAADLVPLVELYTSEGCDSCPPADRWLTARFPPVRGASGASVLAFHVDYWDRLGWKDRFASPSFTERQYATMRANAATFVYTPQVVVQGRDVAGWQRETVDGRLADARKRPARAAIAVDLEPGSGGALAIRAEASVTASPPPKNARLWLAYTESGLVSDVKAGENRGVRLAHDHVVRGLHGPFAFDESGHARAVVAQQLPAERGTTAAVVAFVQDGSNGEVLQTLSTAVCATR